MYRHILLPVDGSRLSEEAAASGIALARALGARVTALHVVAQPTDMALEAWAHSRPDFAAQLSGQLAGRGGLFVENVCDIARRAGVPCEPQLVHGGFVHAEILATARDRGCDLIVMASHSRSDAADVVLGSETVKVMTLGSVPVLVHHPRTPAPAPARAATQAA